MTSARGPHDERAGPADVAARENAAHAPERVEVVRRGHRMVKRVKVGGCWYRTLDLDAGIRAYMGPRVAKRFWHGYYSGKAVDHFTGGVIPIVDSASRQEYDLFDDHLGIRAKVRDVRFHRLRANAAALVEWPRICFCEGWLGSPRRNHRQTKRGFQERGERIAARLADMRVRMGVAAPYGAKAEQLPLGLRTPPSRRPRGAPVG
jgi:hypothetical protein